MRRSSFTAQTLIGLVGESGLRDIAAGRHGLVRRALAADGSAAATLARLFLLGDDVAADELASHLPFDEAGPLLARVGPAVRASYDVAPHADEDHDWWVVSDRTDGVRPLRPDHVLGVGGASTTLAQLTVRRPVSRALDIGTGCGVQALHLSTHCTSVTATDVVPRAIRLAATTFALSGVEVDLREGDLVEPVRDGEFDLVVCNPPFVVGPTARFAYRDAGWSGGDREGDALSRAAVRSAASVLSDGGVAQLLVNWLHVRGEDWHDRVADWVADLGVDALLLERDVQDPGDYVTTWLADAGEQGDDSLAERWLTWFADEEVEAIGLGWVVLRRAAQPHRIAVEAMPQQVGQPLGDAVGGWLDRTTWLRATSDEALLQHAFRVAPDARLDVTSVPDADGWGGAAAALRLAGGFRWTLPCDEATSALVAGCDGSRPLAALVAVLAGSLGAAESELALAVCATVRGLVDRGLLLP